MDELLRAYIEEVLDFYYTDCTELESSEYIKILCEVQNDIQFKDRIYNMILQYADDLSSELRQKIGCMK